MKKATVFVAYINSDLTEGKGFSIPLVVCQTKTTAMRLGKGKNVQGSNALVRPVDLIEIEENGVAKWYAPVDKCLNIILPSKQDREVEKQNATREKLIQKAKDLGLSDEEITLLQEVKMRS